MFTGIIETIGQVTNREEEGANVHLHIRSSITHEMKIDQSVAHNGVCLTVVDIQGDQYKVTAVEETLDRSNIGMLMVGNHVNLERSIRLGDRLDGHMVQGHVDCMATLTILDERDGSWWLTFTYPERYRELLVEKGSVCVNGVSLTVAEVEDDTFSVAIIPYTWEHTNLQHLWVGEHVNIEFDIAAKYYNQAIAKYLQGIN
ncbi:MAG TPA: riboflavin synthase [Chitinophagales bacterium]|nr:riboflavin synthase [Chitinophagales bacterium]